MLPYVFGFVSERNSEKGSKKPIKQALPTTRDPYVKVSL
jgi:hypothetical protein